MELFMAQPEARPPAAPIHGCRFGQKAGSGCDAGGVRGGCPHPPMIYTGCEAGPVHKLTPVSTTPTPPPTPTQPPLQPNDDMCGTFC